MLYRNRIATWLVVGLFVLSAAACRPIQPPLTSEPGASATGILAGRYEGTISIAGMELAIVVTLAPAESGYTGTIDVPEQGASGIPLHDIAVAPPTIHLEMLSGPQLAVFEGEIAADGAITGKFTQSGMEGTFTLTPAAEPGAAAPGASATDTPAPGVSSTYTDPAGRFSVPIPTNWTLAEHDGYVLLADPDQGMKVYLLALETDDLPQALVDAWATVDPAFALPIDESLEPPSEPGIERTLSTTYDTGDDARLVQGVAQLKDGISYVLLLDTDLTTLQKRGAQLSIVGSGFDILAAEEADLSGAQPEPVTAEITGELEKFIADYMDKFGIPGAAVGIVQDGQVVYAKGFGVADPATGAPMTPDTQMMIGSTGKSLTTLLMATLVDDGLMTWDTPAVELYPDFRVKDPELSERITMRNLVCACTGVPRRDAEMLFNASEQGAEETVAALADFEFFTDFGEAFQYSNQMVATAGYIAGAVAEPDAPDLASSYTAALQARVLDPLGMENTTISFADVLARGNYATPHTLQLDYTYAPLPMALEETLVPVAPAGVHWSTLADMLKYMQMQLADGVAPDGTRVVSAANLNETRQPQIAITADTSYGLGWMVGDYKGQPVISHGGNTMGFTSGFTFLPEAELGVVVLTNARASNFFNDGVAGRLLELVFAQEPETQESLDFLLEQIEKQTKELQEQIGDTVDAEAVSSYLGAFQNEALGEITLSLEDDKLFLDAGEFRSELRPKLDDDGELEGYIQMDPPFQGAVYKFKEDAAGNPTIVLGAGADEYTFEQVE